MDKKKKEKLFIGTTFSVLLAIVLLVFRLLNYIDSSVILIVYFPIWLIAIVAIIFGKVIFGKTFLTSASIGLIVEYIIHQSSLMKPSMSGAFLNTAILVIGVIVGIIFEFLKGMKINSNLTK